MEDKRSREGLHYKNTNKKEIRKIYTVEDITIESTNISKDDVGFEAAQQSVKRILARIKSFIKPANLIITESFKPIVVRIVRKVYFSEYGIDNLTLMLRNKLELQRFGDSGGEDEIWPKLSFIENVVDIPTDGQSTFQNESQEFKDIVDKILEKVYTDMTFLSVFVFDSTKKMGLIKEYLEDLKDEDQAGFFESWRSEIRQINTQQTNRLIDESKNSKLKNNN